jgi:hypothetical protein
MQKNGSSFYDYDLNAGKHGLSLACRLIAGFGHTQGAYDARQVFMTFSPVASVAWTGGSWQNRSPSAFFG